MCGEKGEDHRCGEGKVRRVGAASSADEVADEADTEHSNGGCG